MTVQDFIKYYKNGHGRAVYALQSVADKEPYRKAFFECLGEQECFFHAEDYIPNIAKSLLTKEIEKEFTDILIGLFKEQFPADFFYTLDKFLPREKTISLLEEEYKKAFDLCFTPSENEEEQSAKSFKYHCLVFIVNKFLGDDDERLKALITDSAKLAEAKLPHQLWFLRHHQRIDEDRVNRLFDEALKDHPLYDELRSVLKKALEFVPVRREYKTPEDYVKGTEDDYKGALESFCKADAETVKQVARMGIGEDAELGVSALSLFDDYSYEYCQEKCNHQPFPFDSKCLIEIVERYKTLFSPELDSPIEGQWACMALSALTAMKDEAAKEYCISMITDESVHEIMSYEAFGTFRRNYKSTDGELLKKLYYSGYENEVLLLLLSIASQGIREIPYELCFDAYENGEDYNRSHAVFTLSTLGLLTDEMTEECKYDVSPNVRNLVNGLPSEDPHVIRTGYRDISGG